MAIPTFGEALLKEMTQYGHQPSDTARVSGLARSTISHYAVGTRRPDMHALALLICHYPRLLIWYVLYAEEVAGSKRDLEVKKPVEAAESAPPEEF